MFDSYFFKTASIHTLLNFSFSPFKWIFGFGDSLRHVFFSQQDFVEEVPTETEQAGLVSSQCL